MPNFSSLAIIFLVAACIIFLIAKLLKVEKLAVGFVVGVLILWVVLHLTGYDKTLYHIVFEAPPVQPADYRYR
jgi:Na+/H+ antiporter NhaA